MQPIIDKTDAASEPKKDPTKDILDIARDRYQLCVDANEDNLKNAKDDLLFLTGGTNQWEAQAVAARTTQGLPMITVNTLPTYLHQVTNDQRMNTPAIKVHPVDDNADEETAKVIQGLIRHIEYDSNADVAEDTAVNSAAAVGFGYFRLITAYESDTSFDQVIKYQRIANCLAVKIDPLSVDADGSDMQYCFIESLMDKGDFKREWPDANACNDGFFNDDSIDNLQTWVQDKTVLICEYYCIEKTPETLLLLSNGESGYESDLKALPEGVTVVTKRPTERRKVMLRKITAFDVLEETEIKMNPKMGIWIPVFPVYGDEINIAGKIYRSGIVRNAKGPAQMYNVAMTAATEEVMLRSKTPYIMAEGQEQGHEDEFSMANRVPLPYLLYKPVSLEGNLAPAPQRNQMADIPAGMLSLAMHASDNIKKTTGLFDASLGAKGTATSGVQERAQQQEGDMANFHYMDGLLRSLRHCGRCQVSMIPYYYDAKRTVRILGEDDSAQHVTINEPQINEQTGKVEKILNNMSAGTYDITIANGPSYTTMRQESAEFFANAMQSAKDPATSAVLTYLAMKNQDVPGADIATKMMKALLPPQVAGIEEAENGKDEEQTVMTQAGPLPLSQVPQAIAQLQQQAAQATQALQQVDAAKQQEALLKQQNEQAKLALDGERVKVDQFNAETNRFKAQKEADDAEIKNLQEHERVQIDAKAAERMAIDGNSEAFEAWKTSLECDTRIRVAEIAARSGERKAALSAHVVLNKPQTEGRANVS